MKLIKADILADIDITKPTVVLHGCNCFHTMGAGIAAYLVKQYPEILSSDLTTERGSKDKLGTYSKTEITSNLFILNCYTQYSTRSYVGQEVVDYDAVGECLQAVKKNFSGWEIRSSQIGCGLAGGDWEKVSVMFEDLLTDEEVKIYYL